MVNISDMNKILLIGGNGYLGSTLYQRLIKEFSCESIDLCVFGEDLGYSRKIDFAHLDSDFLHKFHWVILLAAHSSVPLGKTDPKGTIQNNVVNLIQLQNKLLPRQKLIYASSTGVYGSGIRNAVESDQSFQAINYYDISKQVADLHMQTVISQGANVVGLRFGTLCGSSPNTRIDMILNSMVYNAMEIKDFWYNNPQIMRSILHIDDAVDAILKIITGEFVPGVYNVKSFDTSIEQAAYMVSHQTGRTPQLKEPTTDSYDFTVSSRLFDQTYNFVANKNLDTTVRSLIDTLPSCFISYRNKWTRNQGLYEI